MTINFHECDDCRRANSGLLCTQCMMLRDLVADLNELHATHRRTLLTDMVCGCLVAFAMITALFMTVLR